MLRRFGVVMAVFALVAVTGFAGTGNAGWKYKYSHTYMRVAHKLGKRAPGRQIVRFGVVGRHGKVRPATRAQIVRSWGLLHGMLHPPAVPHYLTPTRPVQGPAGSMTMRATGGPLAAIRQCESGGNYSTNTGNGFYGAYQFTLSTWRSVGGTGLPSSASPGEQDARAAVLRQRSGTSPWPVCGR